MATDAPEPSEELARIVAVLGTRLGAVEGEPVALPGGITNRNYRVRLGGVDYVVRITGKDTRVLGIDREAEVAATRAAHEAGVAPPVADYLPDEECLVTRFLVGRPVSPDELRDPVTLGEVATSIRMVHDGPPFPNDFNVFRMVERYRDEVLARGGAMPEGYEEAAGVAARIETVMTGPEHVPVPCHNDLLTANFIHDGARVRIVDWEYAGMGDRYFDLGGLSVNNDFDERDDERLLTAYFGVPADAGRLAKVRLMRIMFDFREAMWGAVQAVVSELDFDYGEYSRTHLRRLLDAAHDPRFEEWLHGQTA